MKKFFAGLCTTLLLSAVVAMPFKGLNMDTTDNVPSTRAFFIAIEGY